jgi:hypothetical protein
MPSPEAIVQMNTLDSLHLLKQMPINRCTTVSAARDFTLLAAWATVGGGDFNTKRRHNSDYDASILKCAQSWVTEWLARCTAEVGVRLS